MKIITLALSLIFIVSFPLFSQEERIINPSLTTFSISSVRFNTFTLEDYYFIQWDNPNMGFIGYRLFARDAYNNFLYEIPEEHVIYVRPDNNVTDNTVLIYVDHDTIASLSPAFRMFPNFSIGISMVRYDGAISQLLFVGPITPVR